MKHLIIIFLLLFSSCAKAGPRLVVFGDSISYGYYADFPYPRLLANEFGLVLENHSVSSTILDSPAQIGAIRSTQIYPGDKIVFSPGINDAHYLRGDVVYRGVYEARLREALDKFERSGAETYIGEPLHVLIRELDDESAVFANILLRVLAQRNYKHVHLVSSRGQFKPSSNNMHDSVHPNTRGHIELFGIFKEAMK